MNTPSQRSDTQKFWLGFVSSPFFCAGFVWGLIRAAFLAGMDLAEDFRQK